MPKNGVSHYVGGIRSQSGRRYVKERIDEELREFSLITSAHGFRHIFHGYSTKVKFIFFVVWAFTVSFCIFRASKSVAKYFEQATTTRYEMHPASASAIMEFPTVTVCNYNRVMKSYFDDKPKLAELWKMMSNYDTVTLNKTSWDDDSPYKKYESLTYSEVLRQGQMLNDTFLSCTQARMRYCWQTEMGAEYFVRDVEHVSGSCFRINPNGDLNGKSGDYGVLSLIFMADQPQYMYNHTDVGWILAAHESEQYGSSIDNGIKITPGFSYSINVSPTHVKNHKNHCERAIGKKSGYGRYAQTTCLQDCRDRQLNDTCGCLLATPPINYLNYTECTLRQVAECGMKAYVEYVYRFSDVTSDQTLCECDLVACDYTIFGTTITTTPIANTELKYKLNVWKGRERLKRFHNYTVSDLRNNMAIIEVFFGSSSITNIEEVISYDFDNLLGDIGGVMGLFLGASLFTVLEFFTLFIALISRLVYSTIELEEELPDLMNTSAEEDAATRSRKMNKRRNSFVVPSTRTIAESNM